MEEMAMKHQPAFLALAVLTLACWISVPSKSYAQLYGRGPWGGWGPGYYGWGSYGLGGYGLGVWNPVGLGLGGYGSYPLYAGYNTVPNYGYTPFSYYASPTNYAPRDYVQPTYITLVSTASGRTENQNTRQNRAYVYVEVPANAQVFFDNTLMQQQGKHRVFKTPPLQPNETGYVFDVTARWTENGNEHREKRLIRVTPGGTTNVNFLPDRNGVIPAALQSAPAPQARPAEPPPRPSDAKK
jgi:uncharacterized protein (TIGR03000 family)